MVRILKKLKLIWGKYQGHRGDDAGRPQPRGMDRAALSGGLCSCTKSGPNFAEETPSAGSQPESPPPPSIPKICNFILVCLCNFCQWSVTFH